MKILTFLLVVPTICFAQNPKIVFVESGVSFYKPFAGQGTEKGGADTYFYDFKYTYKTTESFYVKCGIELLSNNTKRFNVTVPMAIGYKEFKKETIKEGEAYGCFFVFNGIESNKSVNKCVSLIIGPKINYNLNRLTIYSGLNINTDLFFQYKEESVYNGKYQEIDYSSERVETEINDITFNTSLQIGTDYKISDKLLIGISTEGYFYKLNPLFSGYRTGNHIFNIGYGNQSIFINSGLKLGYSF